MIKLLPLMMGLCYVPFAQGMDSRGDSLGRERERCSKTNLPFTLLDLQEINKILERWAAKNKEKFKQKQPSKLSDFCEFLFEQYPTDETFLNRMLGEEHIEKWKEDSVTHFKPAGLLGYLFKDISNILKEKLSQQAIASTHSNHLPEAFIQSIANFSKEDQSTLIKKAIDLTQADLNRPGNQILLEALTELQAITFENIFGIQSLFFFLNQEVGEKIKEEKEKAELELKNMCAAVEAAKLELNQNPTSIQLPPTEESKSPYNSPVYTPKNDRQDPKALEELGNKNLDEEFFENTEIVGDQGEETITVEGDVIVVGD